MKECFRKLFVFWAYAIPVLGRKHLNIVSFRGAKLLAFLECQIVDLPQCTHISWAFPDVLHLFGSKNLMNYQ